MAALIDTHLHLSGSHQLLVDNRGNVIHRARPAALLRKGSAGPGARQGKGNQHGSLA